MQNLQTTSNTSSNKGNNPLTPTGGQGALFGEEEKPQGEKAPQKQDAGELYREFIGWMAIAVKKKLRGDSTSRGAFNQRLKEGYTMEDFRHAIKAAWEDDYHRKTGYKHLTAEYITRPAQMEKWVNVPLRSEARANRPTSSLDASEEERRARMRQMGITH